MFDMPLGKHWLGPTKYTWADFQCAVLRFDNELEQKDLDDLGVCKEECEKKESCNAILVADATCNDRPCIKCQLRNCTFPVPAPCGPNGECRHGEMADSEFQGYYQATGKKANIRLVQGLIKKYDNYHY